jgi:hypothetical protein
MIVKKFAAFILLLLYFASTSGATIDMHYCMGKLVSWKISNQKQNNNCEKCGMVKSFHNGCCKDETTQLKVGDQKIANASLSIEKLTSTCLVPTLWYEEAFQIPSISESNPLINAPPFNIGVPLFIRNRVFRI